jgi:hypothetical protein
MDAKSFSALLLKMAKPGTSIKTSALDAMTGFS